MANVPGNGNGGAIARVAGSAASGLAGSVIGFVALLQWGGTIPTAESVHTLEKTQLTLGGEIAAMKIQMSEKTEDRIYAREWERDRMAQERRLNILEEHMRHCKKSGK